MELAFSTSQLWALAQVVLIDIALAGDNAVVVGMAAAGLPPEQRRRAIILGIAAAAILRIFFALITVIILDIAELVFAGGLLLVWVCYKMFGELRGAHAASSEHAAEGFDAKPKTFAAAMWQITIADVSMSLDNVLAVAAASRDHPYIMAFGLALSVVLMGVAASYIARLLDKHRWIGWAGLILIVYVSLKMLWDGWPGVARHFGLSPDPTVAISVIGAAIALYVAADLVLKRRTGP
ncbi:YjbE family putative metal transport protein [Elioraea rosea]|uniref:YjbE family putative metal transport protein n=1 Tax=Elioraea rosea TaxID=2492390 RepID=UPI001183FA32|nr:YjbE family putative metal transport protein [Elioraea rosea]